MATRGEIIETMREFGRRAWSVRPLSPSSKFWDACSALVDARNALAEANTTIAVLSAKVDDTEELYLGEMREDR